MMQSKLRIAGWVLTVLVSLFLAGPSAAGKFVEWEGKEEMFQKIGITNEQVMGIGVLEIALALLLLIPRTSFLAGILLTGYLGGAVMTHFRMHDWFIFPIAIGVLMWIGLGLKRPEIFSLALGQPARPVAPV
jgi:hypothetical protein